MRKTVVMMSCDACSAWKHDDEGGEGVEAVHVAGGYTLDLCAEHREGMRAVLALIAEWSLAPARAKVAARKVEPNGHAAPELVSGGKRTRRGGVKERGRKAARDGRSAVSVDVLACPLCGHVSPTVNASSVHLGERHGLNGTAVYGPRCPLCTHEGHARGLGVHVLKHHGISGVAAAFARAKAAGDPYGVVAERAEAVASLVSRLPEAVDERVAEHLASVG